MHASDNLQKSGRSASRIIEDLLRLIPGKHDMLLTGLERAPLVSARPLNNLLVLDPSPEPHSTESLYGTCSSYFFIMANNMHHVALTVTDTGSTNASLFDRDSGSMDFHLDTSKSAFNPYTKEESYYFDCILTGTLLNIVIRTPEFSLEEMDDFSEQCIAQRFERFHAAKPTATVPSPAQCFLTLYKIIEQPLASTDRKEMKTDNPTLNMRINPRLLYKLGFTLDEERNSFVPPDLHDYTNPQTVALRRLTARRLLEVAARALRAPGRATFVFHLEPALRIFQGRLGCQDYFFNDPRESISTSSDIYSFYVSLGAGERDLDNVLVTRYEAQCANDPENAPVYLDALKNIAESRRSEALQIKVVELMSLGAVVSGDVDSAYAKFNLEPRSEFDPELLIQTYKETIKDQSSSNMTEVRYSLNVIANTSGNSRLKEFLAIDDMTIDSAYTALDASPEDIDESLFALFEVKLSESEENEDKDLDKIRHALLIIAKARNSSYLMDTYEILMQAHGKAVDMDIHEAYELLGVDSTVDEDNVIAVFEIRSKDSPDQILELRSALRSIATYRQAVRLLYYLKSGSTEGATVTKVGDPNWPVGLNNIGNTCYLNSLLQFYFTLTPIREAVCSFPNSSDKEEVTGLNKKSIVKKVGGRDVPAWEVARAQEFVLLLGDLFQELMHTREHSVSPTKDLAYLALIPSGDEPDEDLEIVIEEDEDECDIQIVSVANCAAQDESETDIEEDSKIQVTKTRKFNQVPAKETTEEVSAFVEVGESPMDVDSKNGEDGHEDESDKENKTQAGNEDDVAISSQKVRPAPPAPFVSPTKRRRSSVAIVASGEEKSKRIDNALVGRQQDVTECIENVLFQIEAAFRATGYDEDDGEQVDIVKELFYGKTKQVLASAVDGSSRREKVERFNSLLVDVADGPRDIYGALDAAFREQVFDLEDGRMLRTMTIERLPPILQIQVQRVQYDRVLNQPFKSLALLQFDRVIYMDRYLDSSDDSMTAKRRQVTSWRRELKEQNSELVEHRARQNNNITITENLEALKRYFTSLPDDSELKPNDSTIKVLEEQIEKLENREASLQARIAELEHLIKDQFINLKEHAYRIHSVFIHKGQASFGHYWIYIYDHVKGIFRKYNDETVTEASDSQVFDLEEHNTATPYFLVYIKDDLFEEYTQSVVRELTPLPTQPAEVTEIVEPANPKEEDLIEIDNKSIGNNHDIIEPKLDILDTVQYAD